MPITAENRLSLGFSEFGIPAEREVRAEKIELEPTVEIIGSISEVVAAKARGKEVYLIMK